jgi:hypothetical protein
MADEFINIKDLPELSEIRNGDYIIVESTTGTHLIDFKNFIMPTDNTIISNTVAQNTNAILSLSTAKDTSATTLSSDLEIAKNSISTLSNSVTNLSSKNILNLGFAKTQITISTGNKMGTGTLSQTGNWELSDVIVTPANEYAAKFGAYPIDITTKGVITIQGTFSRTMLSLINTPSVSLETSLRPSNNILSSYTVSEYSNSLSVNPSDLYDFVTSFSLSSIEISAEEDAIYNVVAIKL